MPSIFESHARNLRAAIERARTAYIKKSRPPSTHESLIYFTSSPWDLLPIELHIDIFSQCGLKDLHHLRLVSRAFCSIISTHEQAIVRAYLRNRRRGTLPESSIPEGVVHTLAPEDDVILLSDLFPPPQNRRTGVSLYSMGYLQGLQRRQDGCGRLAGYVAERVVERFLQAEPAVRRRYTGRKDWKDSLEGANAVLKSKLTPLMFYASFFLETYAHLRLDHQNALLIDYDAGRLPVPMHPSDRLKAYLQLQTTILQSPPFTTTTTLISTHHALHLLFSCLRRTISPDPPHDQNDTFVSMLLSSESGLARIVEFFAAEKERAKRRDFMRNMQEDWERARDDKYIGRVYGTDAAGDGPARPPKVGEIWFKAAKEEMKKQKVVPHVTEDWVEVWGTRISVGCESCHGEEGWLA